MMVKQLRPLLVFAVIVASAAPLLATPEDESPTSEDHQSEQAYWIQINPGVRLHRTTMQIHGHGYLGLMTHSGAADLSLDVKSNSAVLSQQEDWSMGVYLLVRSGPLHFDRQLSSPWIGGGLDLQAFPENFLLSSDIQVVNAGTRMDGYYAFAVPTFFFTQKRWKGVRIGGGIGPSYVQASGTIDMVDSSAPFTFAGEANGKSREQILREVGYYHLTSGLMGSSTDAVRRAMLMQLDAPGMLENYGAYAYMKGWGTSNLNIFSLLALSQIQKYFPYPLTPLEAYGLFSLARTNIELKQTVAPALLIFMEVPINQFLTAQISFGGPVFYHQGYQYNLRTFEAALSVPLRY